MPRTKPTTTFAPRTKPTTEYTRRTSLDYLIQEALGKLLLEDGSGALLLERSINNKCMTPRQGYFIEDLATDFVLDLSGDSVLGISGTGGKTAGINTNWI